MGKGERGKGERERGIGEEGKVKEREKQSMKHLPWMHSIYSSRLVQSFTVLFFLLHF